MKEEIKYHLDLEKLKNDSKRRIKFKRKYDNFRGKKNNAFKFS